MCSDLVKEARSQQAWGRWPLGTMNTGPGGHSCVPVLTAAVACTLPCGPVLAIGQPQLASSFLADRCSWGLLPSMPASQGTSRECGTSERGSALCQEMTGEKSTVCIRAACVWSRWQASGPAAGAAWEAVGAREVFLTQGPKGDYFHLQFSTSFCTHRLPAFTQREQSDPGGVTIATRSWTK